MIRCDSFSELPGIHLGTSWTVRSAMLMYAVQRGEGNKRNNKIIMDAASIAALSFLSLAAASAWQEWRASIAACGDESDEEDDLRASAMRDAARAAPRVRGVGDDGGFADLVGNTPLVYLRSLSEATGCKIFGKAEFLNPGGSTKDRVARGIVVDAERRGLLLRSEPERCVIVEGTSGSTGISLSLMARSRGYRCHIVMPDDMAVEKSALLRMFGAAVVEVKPAAIVHSGHYCNTAARFARGPSGDELRFYADQFENEANWREHYRTTGPEIWHSVTRERALKLDAFVMSAGTGGTIKGVSTFLKEQDPSIHIFLADPPGSALANKVNHGVLYTPEQSERTVQRHRFDTVTEGVGLCRLTANFRDAPIDHAFTIEDQESVAMSRALLRDEGLFLGSSSAMNCVAAVRAARRLGPGHTIVTVLCDGGQRHKSKFWNDEYLGEQGLVAPPPE